MNTTLASLPGRLPCHPDRLAPLLAQALLVLLISVTLAPRASAQSQEASNAEGSAAPERAGLLPEPRALTRAIEIGTRLVTSGNGGDVRNGLYPEIGNLITGAGWISGGPGYRHWLSDDRAFVDASAAVSWRAYKMVQARVELTRLARSRIVTGAQVRWQDLTQVTYFGEGAASLATSRSEYRLRSANVVGYSAYRPTRSLAVEGRIGWLTRPDIEAPAGTFLRGNPATSHLFANDPVFQRGEGPDYVHGEVSVISDTRNHRAYPTGGGLYRAGWVRYSDRPADTFTFERYEAEGAHFIPLPVAPVVLALHGWMVGTHTGAGQLIPFYLMPGLGGANTLRSYPDYRFHDRALVLLNAEARVALWTHVDAALFVDAGNVAPRLADLNLDRTSYGAGLRVHARRATVARVDLARGDEGWRLVLRMNDPFRFGRLSRRMAAVPFVP